MTEKMGFTRRGSPYGYARITIILTLLLGILLNKTNAQLVVTGNTADNAASGNVGIGYNVDQSNTFPTGKSFFFQGSSNTSFEVVTNPTFGGMNPGNIQFTAYLNGYANVNRIFFVPYLYLGDFSWLSQTGDLGLFYSNNYDGNDITVGSNTNGGAGFVIAPHWPGEAPWSPYAGIRMDNLGNVGIGQPTPQAMLDVAGTTLLEGNVTLALTPSGTVGGAVGIGCPPPLPSASGNYILAVNGNLAATEVVVEVPTNGVFADYVFDDKYRLKPLLELESYLKENKHLPDVPSAKEVEKNGISLGKMNTILVKKVEEQTLYIIELNKQLQQLKKEKEEEQKINVNELYQQLQDLKKQVDDLKSKK
jgi:hypothetical protein